MLTAQAPLPSPSTTRAHIEVRGVVQGVGFRPYVYRLASSLALDGWVKNDGAGVTIEVQGDPARIAHMTQRLAADGPPRARVDRAAVRECALHASRYWRAARGPRRPR